jgi:hypothetical protein
MSDKELPEALRPALKSAITPTGGVSTGDVVTLSITAEAPQGVDVAVPEQALSPFELLDRRVKVTPTDGKQQFSFELDLLVLEPGEHSVPALSVRVVGPKGELLTLKTEAHPLKVASLIENEPNAELKPVTGPVVVMQDDYTLAYVGAGVLAIALVIALTMLVQRWLARRPKEVPPPPPPIPPWELALERLEQLKRKKDSLIAQERAEELVDGVSDVLREYLGRRYGFDGLESTSDEVVARLEKLRPHKLSLSGVSLLLTQCDLVKFARMAPDAEQCDDLLNGVLGLVRATMPAPEPMAPVEHRPGASA